MGFGIKRTRADALFSDLIRTLADWCCERCKGDHHENRQTLHLSHFWSRRNRSVRFDKENVAILCFACHRFFTENPAEHTAFFLKRLGQARLDALGFRARQAQKVDETALALGFKMELEKIKSQKKFLTGWK